MERYRIVKEIRYSGCIPIVVYCVQVRKDKRLSYEWVNVKGFDTYKRAKELLFNCEKRSYDKQNRIRKREGVYEQKSSRNSDPSFHDSLDGCMCESTGKSNK